MFEKVIPVPHDLSDLTPEETRGEELLIGNVESARSRSGGGGALRALEWNEVTARLNAARDLRLIMRRDSRLNVQSAAASFGDAAATYFKALEHDEHDVNPNALEHCKASDCIVSEQTETQSK